MLQSSVGSLVCNVVSKVVVNLAKARKAHAACVARKANIAQMKGTMSGFPSGLFRAGEDVRAHQEGHPY
jgi:hypothetical protein